MHSAFAFLLNDDFSDGRLAVVVPIFSLALEVRYFLVFPIFEKARDWGVVAACLVCSAHVAGTLWIGAADQIETASYRALVGVLPLFLVGYLMYRGVGCDKPIWARGGWLGALIGLGLFVAILALEPATTHWVGEMAFAFIVTPPLLMLALRVKPSKMDTLAGYLAYGVFLVHLPVIRILHLEERNHLHFLIALVLATLISLALHFAAARRSEERRVGKECVRTGRSRWSSDH